MRNLLASDTAAQLGILIARLALGAALLTAGYAHYSGPGGVGAFADSNAGNIPRWIGRDAGIAYSKVLPFIEMGAGGMLILGLTTRFGAFLAAATTAIVLSARGIHLYSHQYEHLSVYLATAILLMSLGGGSLTVDSLVFRKRKLQDNPTPATI